MAIQSLLSFATLLILDYRLISKVKYFLGSCFGRHTTRNIQLRNDTLATIVPIGGDASTMDRNIEDDDVVAEAERIQTSSIGELMATDVLVLNNVEKVYNGVFHAVDQISIGVKKSECFGLLGVNGA